MTTAWKFATTALLGLAVMLSAPSGAAGAPHPLDPLRVTFSYWDHHWFVWLPRDPVFEAAEIHANDATEPGGKPLVWVYFTQRAVPKTQTNYTNDAAFANAKHWLYRDIDYTLSGRPGEPRAVAVKFSDDRGRTIAITVGFAAGSKLGKDGAGVTDQMGHGAANAFLLLYRDATGTPQSSSVSIDGVDVSKPVPGAADPLPFHAAYSPSTINAAILFGTSTAGFGTAASGAPDQLLFSEAPPPDAAHRLFVARSCDDECAHAASERALA